MKQRKRLAIQQLRQMIDELKLRRAGDPCPKNDDGILHLAKVG